MAVYYKVLLEQAIIREVEPKIAIINSAAKQETDKARENSYAESK